MKDFSVIGGGGKGREKSSSETAGRSGFGEMDSERPMVRDLDGGVRATGGSMPWLGLGVLSPMRRNDGVGPVLEGDNERARSFSYQHLDSGAQCILQNMYTYRLFELVSPSWPAAFLLLLFSIVRPLQTPVSNSSSQCGPETGPQTRSRRLTRP